MDDGFLQVAETDKLISLCSENKIFEILDRLKKAVIIHTLSLDFIQKQLDSLKQRIQVQKNSQIDLYEISRDSISVENLGNSSVSEAQIVNMLRKIPDYDKGYVFVICDGVKLFMLNGDFNESIKTCFMKTKTMNDMLGNYEPVSNLGKIFDLFQVECKHGTYSDLVFLKKSKMIDGNVREQELRNILMKFLIKKVKGPVLPEFCTDYEGDEESVDIYLDDAVNTAIIEVKFAFSKRYYEGGTHYSPKSRITMGHKQLDKYATHLAKDQRHIDYGYLYFYHRTSHDQDEINGIIRQACTEAGKTLSDDYRSLYTATVDNCLHAWKQLD